MDITRRCDYALRILEAAYESGDSYVSVADISEQEDIPYAFARSIQHDLVKGGLIKTVRGARGGLEVELVGNRNATHDMVVGRRRADQGLKSLTGLLAKLLGNRDAQT